MTGRTRASRGTRRRFNEAFPLQPREGAWGAAAGSSAPEGSSKTPGRPPRVVRPLTSGLPWAALVGPWYAPGSGSTSTSTSACEYSDPSPAPGPDPGPWVPLLDVGEGSSASLALLLPRPASPCADLEDTGQQNKGSEA